MAADKEAFVDRWSRLKNEKAPERAAGEEVPAVQEEGKQEPAVVLQPIEDLNPQSDFAPFMSPKVDTVTRRAALKKLFADPHYSIPDPYEVYSEDYTKSETIPLEMLKSLNQAQKLLFDEPERKVEATIAAADAPSETAQETAPEHTANAKDAAVGKQDA